MSMKVQELMKKINERLVNDVPLFRHLPLVILPLAVVRHQLLT
jgi:hypothetical protein